MTSQGALPIWKHGSLPWAAELAERAASLREVLEASDEASLLRALQREVAARSAELVHAIELYWSHPYRRQLEPVPSVWQEGSTRLLDYGSNGVAVPSRPLLIVPSLINRAYILDLMADCSFVRWLAERGYRPFLVDWGAPGPDEASFELSDYVAGRLESALNQVLELTGRPPHVIGYCMGGLLALALAQRRSAELAGLVLMATPWDFHVEQADQARMLAISMAYLAPLMDRLGVLPVDVMQMLFASLDPLLAVRKFLGFGKLAAESPEAEAFVALEDWLNDGVPLAKGVAAECLSGWYGRNTPAQGDWRLAGEAVQPEALTLPALCVVPSRDRIVPPGAAHALARSLPCCRTFAPPAGHIGMIVSRGAPARVWRPIADWLQETDERRPDARPRPRAKTARRTATAKARPD